MYNFHHVFTFFLHLTQAVFPQGSRDPDLTDSRCGGTPRSGDSSLRAHLAHHRLPPQLIELVLLGGKCTQLSISVLLKLEPSMSFSAAKKKKRRRKT